jgi:hypothetical protein
MNYKEFVKTKQYHYDLGPIIRDEFVEGIGGVCYLGCLFIEDVATWVGEHKVKTRWYLRIGNQEYDSNVLEVLEQLLYDWAVDEGYKIPKQDKVKTFADGRPMPSWWEV